MEVSELFVKLYQLTSRNSDETMKWTKKKVMDEVSSRVEELVMSC